MLNPPKIYEKEVRDGVAEAVKSQASIAYCSPASSVTKVPEDSEVFQKLVAENKNQLDLYYMESLLVSTNWNANDDVFRPAQTWAARNTPEDKQFNFMHDENDIIGHITGSYIVDAQGNKISADLTEAPENFDIITRVVLYNGWTEEENQERMAQIIAEIDNGLDKWFVSMECLFAGFDYAVIDENGTQSIIARNEESSFLTKHLRVYGGTGTYQGFKIGRALSDFVFSGEGLVSHPANKRSIILKSQSRAFNSTDVIQINEENNMSEEVKAMEAKLEGARDQLEAALKRVSSLESDLAAAQEAGKELDSLQASISDKDAEISNLTDSLAEANTKISDLETAATEASTKIEDLTTQVAEMEKRELVAARTAALTEAGVSEDQIESTLASFEALDATAFDAVVELYKSKQVAADDDASAGGPYGKDEDDDKKKEKKDDDAKADDEEDASAALDDVETEDSSASLVSDEEDETKALAESIASFIDDFSGRSDSE